MTPIERFTAARDFLYTAAECPTGKLVYGAGEFGYTPCYAIRYEHDGKWFLLVALPKGDGFELIDSGNGTEDALRWSFQHQHRGDWYAPVYVCHCCHQVIDPKWQAPIVPGKSGFNYLTCATSDCCLAGHTYTDRTYSGLDLTPYLAKA